MLYLFIIWPLVIVASVVTIGSLVLASLFGAFVGYRIRLGKPSSFVPFPLPKIAGVRILPIYLVGIAALPFGIMWLSRVVLWAWKISIFSPATFPQVLFFAIAAVAILLVFGLALWKSFKQTDTFKMTAAFLKAKKEKVCPMVEFVDE